MITPADLPATWCRMWSEDASLARDMIAEGGRQWSGVTEGLDRVVGPAETTAFIRAYQARQGTTFAPRTLVIDGDERLAYTWDATRRDGTVLTGLDVCLLADGLVTTNWTIPGLQRSPLPGGPGLEPLPPNDRALDRSGLEAVAAGAHPWRGELVVDVVRQTVAGVWSDGEVGGLALLVVVGGAVARSWSIPGSRPLRY